MVEIDLSELVMIAMVGYMVVSCVTSWREATAMRRRWARGRTKQARYWRRRGY